MHSSWKSRGGGVLGYFAKFFWGGYLGLWENQWGGSFLLHFYVELFRNLYRGYMRCPPSLLSPPCVHLCSTSKPPNSEFPLTIFRPLILCIIINKYFVEPFFTPWWSSANIKLWNSDIFLNYFFVTNHFSSIWVKLKNSHEITIRKKLSFVLLYKAHHHWREAMVNWLRQVAHDQEVVGSNPGTVYCMDASDFLAITL